MAAGLCVTPAPAPGAAPRDPRARPGPAGVWHSRQLHAGAGGQSDRGRQGRAPSPAPPHEGRAGRPRPLRTLPHPVPRPPDPDPPAAPGPTAPPRPHRRSPSSERTPAPNPARCGGPGHAGSWSSPALPGARPTHISSQRRTTIPSMPPAERRARPAGHRDTGGGGETPLPAVVAVPASAPEPPPPPPLPPPRWAVFRFLLFGIVGRPVPPRLGAQRGSADGAALFTRAAVRRAAERRGFG